MKTYRKKNQKTYRAEQITEATLPFVQASAPEAEVGDYLVMHDQADGSFWVSKADFEEGYESLGREE